MVKREYTRVLFWANLSKSLLGVFSCVYLYKIGYSYLDIVAWLIIVFALYMICAPISGYIGNKIGFKRLMMISVFLFIITYTYFNFF